MGRIWKGQCGEPGPYDTHCSEDYNHQYSCYDASADVSFNHRQEFDHKCEDPACPTPDFHNEGD